MAAEEIQDTIEATLPTTEPDDLQPEPKRCMPPEEALERIRAGKTVQNARIEKLFLEGEFTQPVCFRNVDLVKPNFTKASFREEVVMTSCTLDRPLFQGKTEFAKNLVLTSSTLVHAHLRGLTVHGSLLAGNVQCRSRLLVTQCQFKGRISFWEAHFKGWVDFKGCDFGSEVDFRSFHAEHGFVLTKCRFAANVLFRGASVAQKFEASGSRFEALLDFSKAKLHDYVYLETVELGANMRWAFVNTVGERVQVTPEQLAGRIASEQAGNYQEALKEYAFLKRGYSALHRYEDEDWAFYRFKVNQRRAKTRSWLKPWTKLAQFSDWLLLDLGCGYGTNPLRAVRTAIIILLAFALIYMVGFDRFHVERLPFPDQEADSWPNRIVVSLFTSVAVFTSGLGALKDVARDWMNVPLMIEALLGTLLWGLFIVAFSRKVIR